MSLARAFTTRRQKRSGMEISAPTGIPPPPDMPALSGQSPSLPTVVRAVSVRSKNAPPIDTSQISSPVELLSTTNPLSYNAPDVKTYREGQAQARAHAQSQAPVSPLEPIVSRSSSDDSDARSSGSSHRSNGTLTDASSVEVSPVSSPHPHDFQSYFARSAKQTPSVRRSKSTVASHRKSLSLDDPTPAVPRRAPSHSKRAHQQLARQKSLGHVSQHSRSSRRSQSASTSVRSSREERSSVDFFRKEVDPAHPFNKELEKVNELAEELTMTVRDVEMGEDQMKMLERGLRKFTADDYLVEIQPLIFRCYPEVSFPVEETTWI